MRTCNRCNVQIENWGEECPLCGKLTKETEPSYEQDFPSNISKKKFRGLIKLVIFAAVVVLGVILAVDFLSPQHSLWTLIVVVSTFYLTFSIIFALTSHRNFGLMIFINVLCISLFSIFIDIETGRYFWSINYVVPGLIIIGTTVITVIITVKPMLLRDYLVYQLSTALMGISSFLITLFDITTVRWPFIAASLYCALTFIGMFLFKDRRTKHELKKRFHV